MTQKQLQKLLATHRALMEYAKHILDDHYYELEERNEETKWLNDYIKHKEIVAALEAEKPDDT